MEVSAVRSAVRSAVLRDRNFSSTESNGSKGPLWSPARTIERAQGETWRDSSSCPLQEPHNEIMLSQGPAVHCIVVSRNSGYIHFQGGGWQPTLQPFLQDRKHYSNRASSGVFSARRTPGREQTPFQCVGLPCWRSSSLNDGLYHCRW